MAARKNTATKKSTGKKATSKKASTKAVKKTTKKKTTTKKSTTAKSTTAKSTTTKSATTKSTKAAPKKAPSLTIASIAPSRDGSEWTLTLSDGRKTKVPSAAAQCVGVRVGGPWSVALAEDVEQAAFEQLLFTRAMDLLAKKGRTTNDALVKLLGGDAAARRAVAELKKHGWVS